MIGIRRWTPEYPTVEQHVRWLNDPEVVRFSEQRHTKHTIGSQLRYLDNFSIHNHFHDVFLSGKHVGTISAIVDQANSVANVGILIGDKSVWRQGVGGRVWRVFCDFLFLQGVRKIEAGTMSKNAAMIKICWQYGMKEEGVRPEHFLLEGGEACDLVMFGILGRK